MGRTRDAEAELNLPPGFRFHPTDEELVLDYLCRKAAHQHPPVPIIAELDLYKFDPWQLPEKALFGQKEWYFFTPRDRKYPNGSRPNRAAGTGYWKATGADKPVVPRGSGMPVGIKKALVFYAGKAPRGAKTNWIMHEYRLADTSHRDAKKKGSLRLDDWVLCRLYNKKNNWEKQQQQKEASFGETTDSLESVEESGSDSFRTPESGIDDNVFMDIGVSEKQGSFPSPASDWVLQEPTSSSVTSLQTADQIKEDNDWFMGLNLDDLQNSLIAYGATSNLDLPFQDYYFPGLASPQFKFSQPSMSQF